MSKEGPHESPLSIEDWEGKIKPALDLYKAVRGHQYDIRRQKWVWHDLKDADGNPKRATTYEVNIEGLKATPGFKDLVDEYMELIASGANVEEGSDIYERMYNRREELERKLGDLDPMTFEVARALYLRSLETNASLSEVEIKAVIDHVVRESKEREYNSAEHHEYLDLKWPAERAFQGMKAEADLKEQDEEAKKRGFSSRQEMWQRDLEKIKEFRKKIGKENFKRWDSIGTPAWLDHRLEEMEK